MPAIQFGYRAASEEFPADVLLRNSVSAEGYGFDFIVTSDHFHPWFDTGGHSSFAMVWLGALGQVTRNVRFGTSVTPPILRYNPALIAQGFGTLACLHPGRVFIGVGTGEAMNEVPLGFPWPSFQERLDRLREAVQVIRLLWKGDFTSYDGRYFKIKDAKLYDKPPVPPVIYVAAAGPKTAEVAGEIGDAFMTVPAPSERYELLFSKLREGCQKTGKDFNSLRKMIEVFVSYDQDYEKALKHVSRWKTVLIPGVMNSPVYDPRTLEAEAKRIDDKALTSIQALICTTKEELVKAAERYIKLGFNDIQMHSSSPSEEKFLKDFGTECLPYLKENYQK